MNRRETQVALLPPKQYSWKDYNWALFGSDTKQNKNKNKKESAEL